MNRETERLNDLLRVSLGSNPLYSWQNTNEEGLQHPMQVFNQTTFPDGRVKEEPIYDSACDCGLNVRIHKPSCKALSRAVTRCRVGPCLPDFPDKWVFCALVHATLAEFSTAFGHTAHYRPYWWWPVTIKGLPPPGCFILRGKPSHGSTQTVIGMIKDHRNFKPAEHTERAQQRAAKHEQQLLANATAEVAEMLGVTTTPGSKGEVSFPTPPKDQRQPERTSA